MLLPNMLNSVYTNSQIPTETNSRLFPARTAYRPLILSMHFPNKIWQLWNLSKLVNPTVGDYLCTKITWWQHTFTEA